MPYQSSFDNTRLATPEEINPEYNNLLDSTKAYQSKLEQKMSSLDSKALEKSKSLSGTQQQDTDGLFGESLDIAQSGFAKLGAGAINFLGSSIIEGADLVGGLDPETKAQYYKNLQTRPLLGTGLTVEGAMNEQDTTYDTYFGVKPESRQRQQELQKQSLELQKQADSIEVTDVNSFTDWLSVKGDQLFVEAKNLPATLPDSAAETTALISKKIGLPLVVGSRVAKNANNYKKNNDGQAYSPEKLATVTALQALSLGSESIIVGNVAKLAAIKKLAGKSKMLDEIVGFISSTGGEYSQERFDYTVEKWAEQKEGAQTFYSIWDSPEARAAGTAAATAATSIYAATNVGQVPKVVTKPIGAVYKKHQLEKKLSAEAKGIGQAGFNSEQDRQSYVNYTQEALANDEKIVETLDNAKNNIDSVIKSENDSVSKISQLQDIIAGLGKQSSDNYETQEIKEAGHIKANKIIDDIFSIKEINKVVNNTELFRTLKDSVKKSTGIDIFKNDISPESLKSETNINNKFNAIKSIVNELLSSVVKDQESRDKILNIANVESKNIKQELDDLSSKLKDSDIKFDKLKKVFELEKEKKSRAIKAAQKAKIETKQDSEYKKVADKQSPSAIRKMIFNTTDKLDKEITNLDKDTLDRYKKVAQLIISQADKQAANVRKDPNATFGEKAATVMYSTDEVKKAKRILAKIEDKLKTRKNIAKATFAKPKSLKERAVDIATKIKGLYEESAKEIESAMKAGEKAKPADVIKRTVDKATQGKTKETITKQVEEVTKYIKDLKEADYVDSKDLPIVDEALLALVQLGGITKEKYKNLKKVVDEKRKEFDLNYADSKEAGQIVKDKVSELKNKAQEVIKDNKNISRADLEKALDATLKDIVNNKLTASEKKLVLETMASLSKGKKTVQDYFTNKFQEFLKDDTKTKTEVAKDIVKSMKDTFLDMLSKEGRQKIETNIKDKVENLGKSEFGKDVKSGVSYVSTNSKDLFNGFKNKVNEFINSDISIGQSLDNAYVATKDFLTLEEDGAKLKKQEINDKLLSNNGEEIKMKGCE